MTALKQRELDRLQPNLIVQEYPLSLKPLHHEKRTINQNY